MRLPTLAPIMLTLASTLAGQNLTQSPEYRALNGFSENHSRFLAIIRMPGHAYLANLPGFICTIYFDTKPHSHGRIKFAVIKAGTSLDDLVEIASEKNSASHQTIECPSGLLKKLRTFSIPHSLTPSFGTAYATVDADQVFILYRQDQTESFTQHWISNSSHPISQLVSLVESSISARLTIRSTRTLPLRGTVLDQRLDFSSLHHRAASAAPVSFDR